jgi:anti-sigma factor RsiW
MTTELRCQELVELVTDYLEGALPPREHDRFEEHLRDCGGCAVYLEQMRQVIRVAGRLRETDIPHEARDVLLRAFRGWKRKGPGAS